MSADLSLEGVHPPQKLPLKGELRAKTLVRLKDVLGVGEDPSQVKQGEALCEAFMDSYFYQGLTDEQVEVLMAPIRLSANNSIDVISGTSKTEDEAALITNTRDFSEGRIEAGLKSVIQKYRTANKLPASPEQEEVFLASYAARAIYDWTRCPLPDFLYPLPNKLELTRLKAVDSLMKGRDEGLAGHRYQSFLRRVQDNLQPQYPNASFREPILSQMHGV